MARDSRNAALIGLLLLLVSVLFPVVFLGERVAPEASLRTVAPWHVQWGPQPQPSALAFTAATGFAAHLHEVAEAGTSTALWDPLTGGGRPGWLATVDQGGAPLALAAAFLAAPGWTLTALVALELGLAYLFAYLIATRLGVPAWGATLAGIAYALAGGVASRLLDSGGSAAALGPLIVLVALTPSRTAAGALATWGLSAAVVLSCGPEGLPWLIAAVVVAVARGDQVATRTRQIAVFTALVLATAFLAPRWLLARSIGEPGVDAPHRVQRSVVTPLALVSSPPIPRNDAASVTALREGSPAERGEPEVGLLVALLAVVGVAAAPRRRRLAFVGPLLVLAATIAAPSTVLGWLGLTTRPFAPFALLVSIAAGSILLADPARSRRVPAGLAALACVVVLASRLPFVSHRLPLAPPREARLAPPVPPVLVADGERVAPLLNTMPPDVAALLGVPDIRANDLRAEPSYAALLDADESGLLPVARLAGTRLEETGARWVIEPLPLRVVSDDIFSRSFTVPAHGRRGPGGTSDLTVDLPAGVTRIGVRPLTGRPPSLSAFEGTSSVLLRRDDLLSEESADWVWYELPPELSRRGANLRLESLGTGEDAEVALDRSGLRLAGEGNGVRTWSLDATRPIVSLARADERGPDAPRPGDDVGTVTLVAARPEEILADVDIHTATTVVALIKFRPALWTAAVDGRAVATAAWDGVWTRFPVPAGHHRVRIVARLPLWAWGASLAALSVMLVALMLGRRR